MRVALLPHHTQLHHFPKGVSHLKQLTCASWRSLLKIIIPVMMGMFLPEFPNVQLRVDKVCSHPTSTYAKHMCIQHRHMSHICCTYFDQDIHQHMPNIYAERMFHMAVSAIVFGVPRDVPIAFSYRPILAHAGRGIQTVRINICSNHADICHTCFKHRWAQSLTVFTPVAGPNGTPEDFRKSARPKMHYAVSPQHWSTFCRYLGPPAEYLAENTEEGHKLRLQHTLYICSQHV